MTRRTPALLVCCVLTVTGIAESAQAAADKPLNILIYGNSFTVGRATTSNADVADLFAKIAKSAGQMAPNVENAAVRGKNLYYHRTTATQTARISNPVNFTESPGFQWDYVILQEYSTKPTTIPNKVGDITGFRNDAKILFGLVQSHSPSVVPVLYETWARHPDNASFYQSSYGYSGASSYPAGAAFMQSELRSSYKLSQGDLDVMAGIDKTRLAPVGDAFEKAGWNGLYEDDLYHQNSKAALMAALIIYETIYQDSAANISYTNASNNIALGTYGVNTEADWTTLTTFSASMVPEPGSLCFLGVGVGALMRRR